jgi:predicted metal-dependent phosphoesterase TrpH
LAASLGIEILAITDHDTTSGLPSALDAAQQWGITVVPGVEISTLGGREELHLLGYFIDPDNGQLQAQLARTSEARLVRAQKMLARLGKLGLPVRWERLVEHAGCSVSIGRPHVAAALLEAGHVSSLGEAFGLWIGRGCPAYVERPKLSPEEAIQLVRSSGGLPVLAHPVIYTRGGQCKAALDLKRWLPRLRRAGLEGIEVYYPHYARRTNRRLLELAIKHGLLITGGSDFHSVRPGNGPGSVTVPWAVWEGLSRRHRLLRSSPTNQAPKRNGQPSRSFSNQVLA